MLFRSRRIVFFLLFTFFVIIFTLARVGFAISDGAALVGNFEQCVAVGNPIMETYPRNCQSGGKTFTENIGSGVEVTSLAVR